ncbi:MliC family protein [Maritimibacter sp. UBA3975]|uniref:MliC family protein n=1 Tax=Maritimibacter sp. UBA3975 TaxID=1946833 RepID=UPI000C0A7245|nr:MliC family protein [Maritimibacter sp. UBA3975]MAM63242.1 hypothetical protein [Maritimibacter sp.]|tara:strand:+ start:3615 stop:4223 length:609 start_codon:yes stop_codon:yes gene_type:complete
MIRILSLVALCVPVAAHAQDGPTFDCAKAEHDAEIAICENADLAALDRRLADVYGAVLDAAGGMDAGAEAAVAELKASQRGWIGGRDECWKSDDLTGCIRDAYLRREGELVATWMLAEPTGTDVWTCDGNPANEVVTTYFDTELPSVRIERGDTVDAGSLTPSASGSRYEASFGRSIWVKGDEALYTEPSPNEAELSCVRSN